VSMRMKSLLWIFISAVLITVMGWIGKFLGDVLFASALGAAVFTFIFLLGGSIIAGRIARARAIIGPGIGGLIAILLIDIEVNGENLFLTILYLVLILLLAAGTGVLGGYIGSRVQKTALKAAGQAPSPEVPEEVSEAETRFCPKCGNPLNYVSRQGAYYCEKCKIYPQIEASQ
jgi:hypothetical protein